MEAPIHNLNSLFEQLGLSAEQNAIEQFIEAHRPLAGSVALHEAPFWTPAQAAFLREEVQNDADWAEVIDQLNTELHGSQ